MRVKRRCVPGVVVDVAEEELQSAGEFVIELHHAVMVALVDVPVPLARELPRVLVRRAHVPEDRVDLSRN